MSWRIILWPFAQLYGFGIRIRNYLFNTGLLKQEEFDIPVISIGNLTTGGTGKTPHVEYLIRLLKDEFKIAVLSRGYGRSSKGFRSVRVDSKPDIIGDEPLQYKRKFPDVTVTVCEKRVNGIDRLIFEYHPEVVLLDDAFQHRYVKPSVNLLLTEYAKPLFNDHLLPMGNLREPKSEKKRADAIVVTKCAATLSKEQQAAFIEKLSPLPQQPVFFSFIRYGEIVGFKHKKVPDLSLYKDLCILLVCGIADPSLLVTHLQQKFRAVKKMIFPDHHQFTISDLKAISQKFDNIAADSKIIITTEKDFMRLEDEPILHLPFFYLPIEVDFIKNDEYSFDQYILNHVRKNKANS